ATIVPQLPFGPNAGASPPAGTPVGRVGLIIKTWGGGGSPEVTADFDYFCLRISDSPPEAAIEATPREGTVPLEVSFSGAGSVDPSGGTLAYAWDFGDAATAAGAAVKHTYARAGLTTATLTVTDDEKNSGASSVELFLSDSPAPFELLRLGDQGRSGLVTVDRTGAAPLYCLTAGGRELGVSTDHGHFLNRKLTGDFKVQARIAAVGLNGVRYRAGLMARLAADARSPNVLMSIDGVNDGYQFQYRRLNAGVTNRANLTITPPRGPLPAWVQLERQGTMFIGSYSTDGLAYAEFARQDMPTLGVPELLVGFAATSGEEALNERFCVELSGFPGGPAPPAKPSGLAAVPGIQQVTLDWNDNPEPNLLGYDLFR
ncbi:MAG: PKD domain-containing protein, partial [Thermoanaerobaculia bacterium]